MTHPSLCALMRASRRAPLTPLAILALVTLAGCGGGGDSAAPIAVAHVVLASSAASVQVGATVALSAHAEDAAGNTLANRSITYTSSDQTKATVSATGVVTGVAPGQATIVAASEGHAAEAAVTVTPGAASVVTRVSGDAQSATVGTAVASPLVAKVADAHGNGVAGIVVTWAATGATVAPTTSTTDASGTAQATATLGTTAGAVSVSATAAGIASGVSFGLTAIAGPPSTLTKVSGDGQTGTVSTALTNPLVAKVADAYGNAVAGATVSWTLAGGGALGAATSVSDAAGRAQATLTFGPVAGTTDVSASASSVASAVTFAATAANPHGRDDWLTYGHDPRRSGASQASIPGPLSLAWRYNPVPPGTRPFHYVLNALPTADAVFLQWGAESVLGPGYVGSTNVDRVTTAGHRAWTFDGGYDTNIGQWGSVWGTKFVFQDDGAGYLDINTGARLWFSGVDWWGETLADASGLYVAQRLHIDGPGPFVAQLDATGARKWTRNAFGAVRGDAWDDVAGMALSNGVLFYAAKYGHAASLATAPAQGVYAWTVSTGAPAGFAATTPTSKISADAANVYLIENGTTLVARAQSDLHVVWSKSVTSPTQQAPVLANRSVLIATSAGVESYVAATGAKQWSSASITGLQTQLNGIPAATVTIVAALGSGTLIATSATDGIHILSLADGHELNKYAIPLGTNAVRNPVIVNDPVLGPVLYVLDGHGLLAFTTASLMSVRAR